MKKEAPVQSFDKTLLLLTLGITIFGFVFFISAALGILASNASKFYGMLVNQSIFLVCGIMTMFLIARFFSYITLKRYALFIFGLGVLVCFLVFVPGLGFEHGGARRWLNLYFTTFQTGELLKIAAVIYCAGWFSVFKDKISQFRYGLLPLLIILSICALALLSQPDTDTYVVLAIAATGMYLAAGAPWKNIVIIGLIGLIGLAGLIISRPYLLSRFMVFTQGTQLDVYGSGYQAYQAILTVGSGGIGGQGIGQSVQKFGFLPEPAGDSIFAVIAEETGMIGSSLLLLTYLLLFLRILYIAKRAENSFGGLLTLGIGILILVQVFLNVGSMIGIIPISGLPLPLISHGGTALVFTLAQIGIILAISKTMRTI